jgi:hypothetical protein
MPATAPSCSWYIGTNAPPSCTCLSCPAGTWGKGGRLSAAKCEPVSRQTLNMEVVLEGDCYGYADAGDSLVTQLRKSLGPYPGVASRSVEIRVTGRTSGVSSGGKVRLRASRRGEGWWVMQHHL